MTVIGEAIVSALFNLREDMPQVGSDFVLRHSFVLGYFVIRHLSGIHSLRSAGAKRRWKIGVQIQLQAIAPVLHQIDAAQFELAIQQAF